MRLRIKINMADVIIDLNPASKATTSKGCQRIETLLKGLEIEFRREFTFRKCKDLRVLPFDFMIIVNGSVAVIEYDGRQHFEIVPRFHGSNVEKAQEKLTKQHNHDLIKNKYTQTHNISLLRIAYAEDDIIEKLVTDFITNVKKYPSTRTDLFSNPTLYTQPYGPADSGCLLM